MLLIRILQFNQILYQIRIALKVFLFPGRKLHFPNAILVPVVLFQYKTAKLFTSEIFAFISAAVLTIFGWGALTHAGAEELMFFFLDLTVTENMESIKI